jgi:small subunit ribosomal protein S16
MLKIKLSKTGKRNQPSYRIVVAEAKSKRDGKAKDYLGFYNPTRTPSLFKIDKKKYKKWVDQGAQPTDTVKSLVEKN